MSNSDITYEIQMKPQKYLGKKGLIILIALLSAFIPLSTDLYLPALPGMAENFQAPVSLMNMTLVVFFVFYAIGTLILGPLSDKYGRKPILLIGLVVYIASSILCSMANNVYYLILWRIFQAIGSGAATAVSMAIIKDSFHGKERVSALALVQSMIAVAPVIAPMIGAQVLYFTTWRGVFWSLAVVGLISFLGVLFLEETIEERTEGNILHSLSRLGVVLKNRAFTFLLIIFSLPNIAMMAYVSGSSYIYINGFGLSEQIYSYFFAASASLAVIGPFIYLQLAKFFKDKTIIVASFGCVSILGVLIYLMGNLSPWVFSILIGFSTTALSILRPPGTNLMFEQQQHDTGSVSSLISCGMTLMGSFGMIIVSLDWANRIFVVGILLTFIALLCLCLWILNKSIIKPARS
jgi:DHA1 family bicyclomycin/chloramphenicol resistance-like MFS transporter